ncbi:uncharacterized protein METZ01_LOCUS56525 [marine metagenome]|uniref:Uncharacterized protein n=1 Tax=marine metagenome TaxID=408172 RepID=A0A381SJZ6_9ZZZZ
MEFAGDGTEWVKDSSLEEQAHPDEGEGF